ncbi:hypothetical protein LCGC14_1975550, partial [marine sediment metagenome]
TTAGLPNGNLLTDRLPFTVTSSKVLKSITFEVQPALQIGTKYVIVFEAPSGVSDSAELHLYGNPSAGSSYTGGDRVWYNGSVWATVPTQDLNFYCWGSTEEDSGNKNWAAVASDSDGSHLIAAIYGSGHNLFTSADSGATWTERIPEVGISNWKAVASDSDGSHLIAIGLETNYKVWTSADYGVTWTERKPTADSPVFTGTWEGVASNSDGSKLIVGGSWVQDELYTSVDYGVTWTARRPGGIGNGSAGGDNASWKAFASSSDGVNLIGAGTLDARGIWVSSDSGVTWTDKTPSADVSWDRVASDSDGSHLMAAGKEWGGSDEFLFLSATSGASWTRVTPAGGGGGAWDAIASNSDGSQLVAAENSGRVYVSIDTGATWAEEQPDGDSDFPWRTVAFSSDGTLVLVGGYSGELFTGTHAVSYSEATWAEAALTSAGRALLDDTTAAAQATTLGVGTGDSPTFTGLTLSGLTSARLVASGSALNSVADLTAWIAGTASQVVVANDGDGTITLSTPQNIHTGASPTFAGLTLSSIAAEASDVDKFLVDSTGIIKFRTGAEVLSDIGASASAHLHDAATLEHDGVNSDGGAFNFTTTGLVTFNQSIASDNYTAVNLLTAAASNAGELDFTAASKKLDVEDNAVVSQDYTSDASPTFVGLTLTGLTATRLVATGGSKETVSVVNLATWVAGITDHISVADDSDGSITLDLDTNTKTLLGSFNGMFLEKIDFTISEAGGTVTGSLEQDSGGDLIQRFSDGYTTL